MHDAIQSPQPPRDWRDAFAALPQETPPPGGWNAVAARLDARRRPRWPLWAASAAAVVLAVALPWRLQTPTTDTAQPPPSAATAAAPAAGDPFERLYAESAQLESLLAVARDERVSSGTAAALSGELETRVASIDAALMQPGLSRDQQLALWQERVDSLRALTGFESNRRWLAAQGAHYDGALVAVD